MGTQRDAPGYQLAAPLALRKVAAIVFDLRIALEASEPLETKKIPREREVIGRPDRARPENKRRPMALPWAVSFRTVGA